MKELSPLLCGYMISRLARWQWMISEAAAAPSSFCRLLWSFIRTTGRTFISTSCFGPAAARRERVPASRFYFWIHNESAVCLHVETVQFHPRGFEMLQLDGLSSVCPQFVLCLSSCHWRTCKDVKLQSSSRNFPSSDVKHVSRLLCGPPGPEPRGEPLMMGPL